MYPKYVSPAHVLGQIVARTLLLVADRNPRALLEVARRMRRQDLTMRCSGRRASSHRLQEAQEAPKGSISKRRAGRAAPCLPNTVV